MLLGTRDVLHIIVSSMMISVDMASVFSQIVVETGYSSKKVHITAPDFRKSRCEKCSWPAASKFCDQLLLRITNLYPRRIKCVIIYQNNSKILI